MTTLLAIFTFLKELLDALKLYFPVKTDAEKQSETAQLEQTEAELLKQSGRPKWD